MRTMMSHCLSVVSRVIGFVHASTVQMACSVVCRFADSPLECARESATPTWTKRSHRARHVSVSVQRALAERTVSFPLQSDRWKSECGAFRAHRVDDNDEGRKGTSRKFGGEQIKLCGKRLQLSRCVADALTKNNAAHSVRARHAKCIPCTENRHNISPARNHFNFFCHVLAAHQRGYGAPCTVQMM